MAIKNGKPATSFNAQNRKWVRDLADSSGGGLPDITESDDGKVLTAENGNPVWAESGGGGGGADIMIINSTDTGTSMRLDKTFAEIATAIKAKTMCYVVTFTEDEETGAISGLTAIVSSIMRDPNHGAHDPEFEIRVGFDTYDCTSADAYPEYIY